ncbi:hypothetical protein PWG71_28625, partial [Nocardiopsis sp. N85]|uniref:hypothetical protein n=1 Tax=Nocardiopsis sp. N85 TaxID=3029400 RepID=UPI00237FD5B2
ERAALHGHPSAIEIIAADYPAWEIGRDRHAHRHGPWRAQRDDTVLTADSPAGLLVKLEAQELARLQAEHTGRWKVWRTPRYWMATALVDDIEPTLMEETPGALESRMLSPKAWGNRPLKGTEGTR